MPADLIRFEKLVDGNEAFVDIGARLGHLSVAKTRGFKEEFFKSLGEALETASNTDALGLWLSELCENPAFALGVVLGAIEEIVETRDGS